MKIIVAVTGASGTIYARQLVELLLKTDSICEVALIFSDNGKAVARYEGEFFRDTEKDFRIDFQSDHRIKVFENSDMFSGPASGSSDYDAMVIIPCSMGTAGRIAGGVSQDLISRAADVMLKERRRLIMVVRETPLHSIHLRNMTALSDCGAVILPASPSFYSRPADIEQLCMTVTERIITLLGIEIERYKWGENPNRI